MHINEVRKNLNELFGNIVTVYSNDDRILYIPEDVSNQLKKLNLLKKLELTEISEDHLFSSLRHRNMGKVMVAYHV